MHVSSLALPLTELYCIVVPCAGCQGSNKGVPCHCSGGQPAGRVSRKEAQRAGTTAGRDRCALQLPPPGTASIHRRRERSGGPGRRTQHQRMGYASTLTYKHTHAHLLHAPTAARTNVERVEKETQTLAHMGSRRCCPATVPRCAVDGWGWLLLLSLRSTDRCLAAPLIAVSLSPSIYQALTGCGRECTSARRSALARVHCCFLTGSEPPSSDET